MKAMLRLMLPVLLPALLLGCSESDDGPVSAEPVPVSEYELQQTLEEALGNVGVPGAAALIVREDGYSWRGSAGVNRVDQEIIGTAAIPEWSGTPMTTDLHTRAGSITKSFTAALILMLNAEGHLALDDVIDDYFPGLVPYSDEITIDQLLHMTAGLIDYALLDVFWLEMIGETMQPEELVQAAVDAGGTSFPPGEAWEYSNTNYVILGMILEQVTGRTYAELVTERIIQPLGLDNTYLPEPEDASIPQPALHGYTWYLSSDFDQWEETTEINVSWAYSAGNVVSNLDDLALWMSALIDGSFLDEASHALMWQTVPTGFPGFAYGCGVLEATEYGMSMRGHNGGMPGYETIAYRYEDAMYVVMTNGNVPPAAPVQDHAGAYIGLRLALTLNEIDPTLESHATSMLRSPVADWVRHPPLRLP